MTPTIGNRRIVSADGYQKSRGRSILSEAQATCPYLAVLQ